MNRNSFKAVAKLLLALALGSLAPATAQAQVMLVNMVPASRSAETNQDSEPTLTINPANPLQIAASAFTADSLTSVTMLGPNAPIYASEDGGQTWSLVFNVPSAAGSLPTFDITHAFSGAPAGSTNTLYAGILHAPETSMRVYRTLDYRTPTPMTLLDTRTNNVDQPHLQAATALGGSGVGQTRVYVGFNNGYNGVHSQTATVDLSLNAGIPSPSFNPVLLETRNTNGQDGFAIVPAAHPDGTVYAIYYGWRPNGTSDVVVVRDDNWGTGPNPFTALTDPSDGKPGRLVVQQQGIPEGAIGQERLGASNLAIAVDPLDSQRVYIAWGEQPSGTTTQNLHVRRSIDGGVNWSADLLLVPNAVNPALAINSHGKVGFLYQQLTGTNPNQRWQTHLVRTTDQDGVAWDSPGLLLANTSASSPAWTFQPYLGDYCHLRTYGKDFYGIFSASNYPDQANFYPGVVYQRYVNWTTHTLYADAALTTPVSVSIDPFFFKVTETLSASDFYVRDWTDSPSSGDNGAEPSTHAVFYATSDVWNRRSTLPGSFPNDQPQNEDAGNGAGDLGDNWAFARIRRNALPPSGSTVVTAHFLVSRFGIGSNYVDAGSGDPDVTFPDPDPTVTFNASDLGPLLTAAYHWHLNATSSTHLCMAVEISAPGDPYIPPSLVGNTPGWPTTDLRIVLDNNKAQRNMGLSSTPAGGVGNGPAFYGIVHNAAPYVRDLLLRYDAPPEVVKRLPGARIEVIGGDSRPFVSGGSLTLAKMQPGENRWIGLVLNAPEGKEGEILAVNFYEVVDNTAVNGFAIGARLASLKQVFRDNLELHRSVFTRLAAGFGSDKARDEVDAVLKLLKEKETNETDYQRHLASRLGPIQDAVGDLLKSEQAADAFAILDAVRALDTELKAGNAERMVGPHTALLNKLDAFLTMRQLSKGDPADILQNVRWQKELYAQVPPLKKLEVAAPLVRQSQNYITAYGLRKVTNKDYPALIQGLLDSFRATAKALQGTGLSLDQEIAAMQGNLNSLAGLQKAHRDYLLKLQTLDKRGS